MQLRRYISFLPFSNERWLPAFYVHVRQSVAIDLCKVYSVLLQLGCEHVHALLASLCLEWHLVVSRSLRNCSCITGNDRDSRGLFLEGL